MKENGFTYLEVLLGLVLVTVLSVPMAQYIFMTSAYHIKGQEEYLRRLAVESLLVQTQHAVLNEDKAAALQKISETGMIPKSGYYSILLKDFWSESMISNAPYEVGHTSTYTFSLSEGSENHLEYDALIVYTDTGFDIQKQPESLYIAASSQTCAIYSDTDENKTILLLLPEEYPALFLEAEQTGEGSLQIVFRSKGKALPYVKALTEDNIFVLWEKDIRHNNEYFIEILFLSLEGEIMNNVVGYVSDMYEVYP